MTHINGFAFLGLAALLFGLFLVTAENQQRHYDRVNQENFSKWEMK